ncbi:MAG: hypothetical protein Q9193_004134 [Seirophora villosa]
MGTTGGAVALIGSEPDGAVIVDKILSLTCTGARIFDADGLPQPARLSQPTYTVDLTGATALEATAAGLAPIAVGTETDGSLVTPSTRASLYTVKPTHGLVDMTNIIPISARYDTAGPMGKTVKDVADLLNLLIDHSKTEVPHGDYASAMTTSWDDIKVGTLDPEKWKMGEDFVKPAPEATKMIGLANTYHANIPLPPISDFTLDGRGVVQTLMAADLKGDMDKYLGNLRQSKVKSLQELVEWNKEHAEEALTDEYPNQTLLEQGLDFGDSVEAREKPLAHSKAVAANFDELLQKYHIDVMIAPGDCMLSTYSAAGGE